MILCCQNVLIHKAIISYSTFVLMKWNVGVRISCVYAMEEMVESFGSRRYCDSMGKGASSVHCKMSWLQSVITNASYIMPPVMKGLHNLKLGLRRYDHPTVTGWFAKCNCYGQSDLLIIILRLLQNRSIVKRKTRKNCESLIVLEIDTDVWKTLLINVWHAIYVAVTWKCSDIVKISTQAPEWKRVELMTPLTCPKGNISYTILDVVRKVFFEKFIYMYMV